MGNEELIKALFHDIGKSTLRGVRKCPKCGTSNGMRGFCCKNRDCDVVFKETFEKKKQSTDVCKICTGTPTQIFSVRVRDKGPDYRGFVQLPIIPSTLNENLMNEPTPLCFVDSCQRTFNTNVLKCHEKTLLSGDTNCQHIQATMRCYTDAKPLHISHAILFSLNFTLEMKQAIWQSTMETLGPVVQKVSKTVMVVKCILNPKYPVGYLHASFNQTQFTCSCPAFKGLMKSTTRGIGKCFHYYACVASFASNMQLCSDFVNFVDEERLLLDLTNLSPRQSDGEGIEVLDDDSDEPQLVTILEDAVSDCEVKIKVLPDQGVLLDPYPLDSISQSEDFDTITETGISTEGMSELEMHGLEIICPENESDPEITTLIVNPAFDDITFSNNSQTKIKKNPGKRTATVTSSSERPAVKKKKTVKIMPQQQNSPKKNRKTSTPKAIAKVVIVDETTVKQPFLNWLASVTERIYETMHFQFSGKPTSLVFHIPQEYFDCLRERISAGAFKKRLPNSTTAFVRKHAVPLGTFTKYTWHITNIIHCKQIFETPMMPLPITRSFVEKKDGSYEPFIGPSAQEEAFSKLDKGRRIRPLELKTFLKVGRTRPDQKKPTPLIIEWIPDILPITKVGELKIIFEYGHRRP